MEKSKNKLYLWVAFGLAVLVQVLTWFGLYPLLGYGDVTLLVAQAVFLALGIGLVFFMRIGWARIGVGLSQLISGAVVIALTYGLVLIILIIARELGGEQVLFRQEYRLGAIANNWILTGFGEELVFAGVLFNLAAGLQKNHKKWVAVLLVAGLFALWHLPGYLAVGMKMNTLGIGLIFDLLLRAISWGFFGTIYLFSGNLWLTAFAHASTDYALLPAITRDPVIGLVFMGIALLASFVLSRAKGRKLA